ncbi:hypothetical protein PGT21_013739 [Puccinia graminis f. sp. tritici]|uniref:Uncharacterized protein n=1 Tax=Puccinia graminis f. sp. tritici TaxID=56615 RepID=A0A5B0Q5G3_PUCGR|nr:hypothetical protein PGT21_013739 [Puccinia graminis f. sp. tritici]KAA1138582.1 hypothetical protein PGTUg99_030058 [Puccinia graminis f. sp. tritici]
MLHQLMPNIDSYIVSATYLPLKVISCCILGTFTCREHQGLQAPLLAAPFFAAPIDRPLCGNLSKASDTMMILKLTTLRENGLR